MITKKRTHQRLNKEDTSHYRKHYTFQYRETPMPVSYDRQKSTTITLRPLLTTKQKEEKFINFVFLSKIVC